MKPWIVIALVLAAGCQCRKSKSQQSDLAAAKPASAECEAVAAHIASIVTEVPKGDPAPGHLEYFKKRLKPSVAAACDGEAWDARMRGCLLDMKALDPAQLRTCQNDAQQAAHRHLTADAREEYYRRLLIAVALGVPDGPLDPVPVPGCSSYLETVNRWFRCAKLPLANRARMLGDLEIAIDPTFPAPPKATPDEISSKCKQREDAIKQALHDKGCD
jgi:hypothetical protein